MSYEPQRGDPLTARELEVLRAWRAADGDEHAVAAKLGLSKHTVHGHLANIRTKMGVRHTWQACVKLAA